MLGTIYDFLITRKEREYLTPRSSRGLLPIHMCKCHRHRSSEKRFIGSAVLAVALIGSDHLIKVMCREQYVRMWERQCGSSNGRTVALTDRRFRRPLTCATLRLTTASTTANSSY